MTSTLIGPFGQLLEVDAPTPGLVSLQERASRELQLISGAVRRQRAPRTARRWTWEIRVATGDEVSSLLALEQGVFGPPPWYWYDPVAAKLNMLSDRAASPGVGGAAWWVAFTDDPADVDLDGPVALDGGRTAPVGVVSNATLTVPADVRIPVVTGRTYTGSMFVSGGDGTIALSWIDADGDPVGSPSSSGSGSGRRVASGQAPGGAAGIELTVDLASNVAAAGLQLTETTGAVPWHPGVGIPQVEVVGGPVGYRLITAQQQLRDLTLELVEVG